MNTNKSVKVKVVGAKANEFESKIRKKFEEMKKKKFVERYVRENRLKHIKSSGNGL